MRIGTDVRRVHALVMQEAARRSAALETPRSRGRVGVRVFVLLALGAGAVAAATSWRDRIDLEMDVASRVPVPVRPTPLRVRPAAAPLFVAPLPTVDAHVGDPAVITVWASEDIDGLEVTINGTPYEIGTPFQVIDVDMDGLSRARIRAVAPGYPGYHHTIYFSAPVTHTIELNESD